MQNQNVLCTICARAGSKGVKNKNIRNIAGKPLIAHTILQAVESNLFGHVVISTDSEEIMEIASAYGAEIFFKRSAELSGDTAGKIDVIKDAFIRSEAHYKMKFQSLVDLDATSPLRSIEDIIQAYKIFYEMNYGNLITAMPSRRNPYFNLIEVSPDGRIGTSKHFNNDADIKRRQDAPKCYDMNASIYIWKRDEILNCTTLFQPSTGLYVMPEERSIDIDSELDFEIVEFLLRKRYNEN